MWWVRYQNVHCVLEVFVESQEKFIYKFISEPWFLIHKWDFIIYLLSKLNQLWPLSRTVGNRFIVVLLQVLMSCCCYIASFLFGHVVVQQHSLHGWVVFADFTQYWDICITIYVCSTNNLTMYVQSIWNQYVLCTGNTMYCLYTSVRKQYCMYCIHGHAYYILYIL